MRVSKADCSATNLKCTFLALFIGLSVSACETGDGDNVPAVDTIDQPPSVVPVEGVFDDEADSDTISFVIDEDQTLYARFVVRGESAVSLDVIEAGAAGSDIQDSGFFVVSLPENGLLTLRSGGAVFNYTPDPDFYGADQFMYAAPDGSEITVSISINSVSDAPIINTEGPLIADQGRLFSELLDAYDGDGDTLRYDAQNLPEWLTLNSSTGVLSGVPQQSDIGVTNNISISVSDSAGLSDSLTGLELEVIDLNDAPIVNISQVPRNLFGRDRVRFDVPTQDFDDDQVSLSVEPDAAFTATINGQTIELEVFDIQEARTIDLTIVGRDELGAVTRETVPVDLYPLTESGKGTTVSGRKEGRGVHVVILGDGYTRDQRETFRDHVHDLLDHIRLDEGIADHMGAFNVHMITSISEDSGADDNDREDARDTVFDSAYNCRSIPRLVCADIAKLYEVSLPEYPEVDQIVLLVNDVRFGGSGNSGGQVAITSAYFPEIALHEMGHSLADLADEYVDPLILETIGQPPFEEGRYSNVSLLTDPSSVPWAHWIGSSAASSELSGNEEVGVFEGGLYRGTGVYRGTFNSRMREYSRPFGPINTEQWILRLYEMTQGIRNLSPLESQVGMTTGRAQLFSVEPIFGEKVQVVSWTLNGVPLESNDSAALPIVTGLPIDIDSAEGADLGASFNEFFDVTTGAAIQALATSNNNHLVLSLPQGRHVLELSVVDVSGRIQLEAPHAGIYNRTWSINVQ